MLQITKEYLISEIEQWNFMEDDVDVLLEHLLSTYGHYPEEQLLKFMQGFSYKKP